MTIDESVLSKVAVPEEFKTTLETSFETVDAVRQFLTQVYEENQTPNKQDLSRLEKKLILENFNIKKQSDIYYQNLKYYQDKLISSKTADINRNLYKEEQQINLQKLTRELNSLVQSSMVAIGQIPELQLDHIKDISNYDKLDLESLYSRDEVLRKLSALDLKIENSEYDETFKKDLKKLQDIIQAEKLQRFKLYILNKSLYTNRYKKLKDLDTKWSARLDEINKLERTLSQFHDKLITIAGDDAEKQEDDMVLAGADNGDDEYEGEEEEEVEEEVEEEEDDRHREAQSDAEDEEEQVAPEDENQPEGVEVDQREDPSITEEEEEDDEQEEEAVVVGAEEEEEVGDDESKKRSAETEIEDPETKKQKIDEMEVDEKEEDPEQANSSSSDVDDIELV